MVSYNDSSRWCDLRNVRNVRSARPRKDVRCQISSGAFLGLSRRGRTGGISRGIHAYRTETFLSEAFEPFIRQNTGNLMAGETRPPVKPTTPSILTTPTPNIEWSMEDKNKIPPLSPSPMEITCGRRKRRTLVIEDSCVVRKSLVRVLDRLGFEVSHTVNSMEGLELLKATMFDQVLCD